MVTGYFGLPGSGKTTFLTMIAQKELKRISKGISPYKQVFSNFYCQDCCRFDFRDLGSYLFEDSLILIDEITLDADSRDFATFSRAIKQFFILHRHYHCDIIYFTQHYNNVDKKIRDLTYDLFFVKSCRLPFLPISTARRIYRTLDIDEHTHDIVHGYRFSSLIDLILDFGNVKKHCFRPRWYKYFDSFEAPRNKPSKPIIKY